MYSLTRLAAVSRGCVSVTKATAAVICTAALCAPVSAGSALGGVITSVTTNSDLQLIYVTTTGFHNGTPACASANTSHWALALNPANNQVYAQLLTALTTQMPVFIWGDGVCNVTPAIETLVQLQVGGTSP